MNNMNNKKRPYSKHITEYQLSQSHRSWTNTDTGTDTSQRSSHACCIRVVPPPNSSESLPARLGSEQSSSSVPSHPITKPDKYTVIGKYPATKPPRLRKPASLYVQSQQNKQGIHPSTVHLSIHSLTHSLQRRSHLHTSIPSFAPHTDKHKRTVPIINGIIPSSTTSWPSPAAPPQPPSSQLPSFPQQQHYLSSP